MLAAIALLPDMLCDTDTRQYLHRLTAHRDYGSCLAAFQAFSSDGRNP